MWCLWDTFSVHELFEVTPNIHLNKWRINKGQMNRQQLKPWKIFLRSWVSVTQWHQDTKVLETVVVKWCGKLRWINTRGHILERRTFDVAFETSLLQGKILSNFIYVFYTQGQDSDLEKSKLWHAVWTKSLFAWVNNILCLYWYTAGVCKQSWSKKANCFYI